VSSGPLGRAGTASGRRASVPRSLSLALLSLLALGLFVSACGGESLSTAPRSAPAAPTTAPAPAVKGGAPANGQSAADQSAARPAAAAPTPSGSAAPLDVIPTDRMVIRDAKLSLQVTNVETALQKVRDIADTYGGYVTASHTSFEKVTDPLTNEPQDRMVADVTIAVRSDAYDRAVGGLRQLATKVESEDGTSQDVTEEYVDLDADLRNLQASEDAILKLIDKAQRLEDVLTLQQQLANVRGQIERIQGRKRYLEHATSMSTISLNLHLPPVEAGPLPPLKQPVWNPLATFERGWRASLIALETIADILIVAVSFGWWLVPFAALGVYAYQRARRRPAPAIPPHE
jgi:Domain of unknown function (DUF4349)